jgi:hypothetical protein
MLRGMADFSDIVLESVGVESYAELTALGLAEILRRGPLPVDSCAGHRLVIEYPVQ